MNRGIANYLEIDPLLSWILWIYLSIRRIGSKDELGEYTNCISFGIREIYMYMYKYCENWFQIFCVFSFDWIIRTAIFLFCLLERREETRRASPPTRWFPAFRVVRVVNKMANKLSGQWGELVEKHRRLCLPAAAKGTS